jgi:hypothetical protein
VEAEEQRVGLAWAAYVLSRLHERDGGDPLGEARAGAGRCDDCERESVARWQLGRFALCRACTSSRRRAADQLEREERHERDHDTRDPTAPRGPIF